MRDATAADDMVQETMIRLLTKAHHYDPDRPFRAWAKTIAANLCRDHLRRGRRLGQRTLPVGSALAFFPRAFPLFGAGSFACSTAISSNL